MNHNFCCFPIGKISDFSNTMGMEIGYTLTCCTWLFMLRASSKKTPMFLATVDNGITKFYLLTYHLRSSGRPCSSGILPLIIFVPAGVRVRPVFYRVCDFF